MLAKEYGKLSPDQFKSLVDTLPELRQQMAEVPQLVRACSQEKLDRLLSPDFYWALFYEFSFAEQTAMLLYALGKAHLPAEAAAQPDPQQACIDLISRDEDWQGPVAPFEFQDVLGLVTILQRNILSIMLFSRPLDVLLSEARGGNMESLYKAVRIDRSIVACPTVAARIARAELSNNKAFFQHLRSALKGPLNKHWLAYRDLRYALYMLRECGFDKVSDVQLEDLLVHKLKLYPNVPGARKNLRKQLNESKKYQAPQNAI